MECRGKSLHQHVNTKGISKVFLCFFFLFPFWFLLTWIITMKQKRFKINWNLICMQAVSSLPWVNIILVCSEKSLLLWLWGLAVWQPLEHCACHFSFSIRFWEALEGAAHMLLGKAWSKHELFFIYFLDNTAVWVCRIALLLFQAEFTCYHYPVVAVVWPLPVLKLRYQVESQKRQKGHRRAQDGIWELISLLLVHIATSIYNLWWQTDRELWEPPLSDLAVIQAL